MASCRGDFLDCNDDGCGIVGGPSKLTFVAFAGQRYIIRIGVTPPGTPQPRAHSAFGDTELVAEIAV